MRWRGLQVPFTRRPQIEKKAVLGTSEALGSFLTLGAGGGASASSSLGLYEQSTAVSIPINYVAESFSCVAPSLFVDGKLVRRHDVLDFIGKPSPHFSGALFRDVMAKNYLITGEAPVVALGNPNQPPLELLPISPRNLTATRMLSSDAPARWHVSGNTMFGNYEAVERGRVVRYLDRFRELVVIRGYSTRDNSILRGQSPLLAASREARSHILGTEHNVQILERGGRVSLVFHFDEDMNEDDFKEAQARIREQYGGASRAGEIGVTAGAGMEIKNLGQTSKDMDFGGLQKIAQKSVALVYRVPLPLVSDERMTMGNYKEAKIALYDDAVIPLANRIYEGLDFVLARFGLDPTRAKLAINPDDVTALVSRRNDEIGKRARLAIETDNELRAQIGREPYAGGDEIWKQSSMVPVGSDLFTNDSDPDIVESVPDAE